MVVPQRAPCAGGERRVIPEAVEERSCVRHDDSVMAAACHGVHAPLRRHRQRRIVRRRVSIGPVARPEPVRGPTCRHSGAAEASDPPRRTAPAGCRRWRRGRAGRPAAAPRNASNSSLIVVGSMSRTMNTMRVRWSSSGQALELRRRMKHVLHAVDHHRPLGRLGDLHDALEPQQVRPVHRAQQIEEHLERRLGDRRVGREREGADVRRRGGSGRGRACVVRMRRRRMRLGGEPAPARRGSCAAGSYSPQFEQPRGGRLAGRRIEDRRAPD